MKTMTFSKNYNMYFLFEFIILKNIPHSFKKIIGLDIRDSVEKKKVILKGYTHKTFSKKGQVAMARPI